MPANSASASDPTHVTHRAVWALAGPMIISNISVPLVGAVDTAVVGRLPEPHHIGAVAIGALIFTFIYWGFGFLRMGTTGFIARAHGANDGTALDATLLRVLLLALFFGATVVVLASPLINLALWLLHSSMQVEQLAGDYSFIRIWSAPATLCVYVFTGYFIGVHNTRRALYLVLTLNATNIALDFLFVVGFDLGVVGVATATLIAEYTAAALGFFMLRGDITRALKKIPWRDIPQPAAMRDLMNTNINIFIRTVCLMFAFAWFTAQSARLGEVVLAANTVLLHFQSIMAFALDGFAHAAEALAGSAFGARKRRAFQRAVLLSTAWATAAAALISAAYFLFGEHILKLFTDIPDVLAVAKIYLPWMAVLPLLSVFSFQLDGIFIGVSRAREMRNAMLVSIAVYLAAVSLLLPHLGNHALFLGLIFFMLIRTATLWRYYPRLWDDAD